MRNACLLATFWLATCTMVIVDRVTGVEFDDQRQPSSYGEDYSYYGGHSVAAPEREEESARTHLAKHKLKKLKHKKRLLLQCLLGHGRRRRDTSEASGRFFLPVVLQSTNVNVGSGGGGYGGHQQQQSHHSGCMQMFGDDNNHGPLGSPPSLGSLGSPLGSLGSALGSLGSLGAGPAPVTEEPEEGGNRNFAADWNRYARQFRRNFVRPLYRLF